MEQRIEAPRKKVLAVSIDFDGCLGNKLFVERYKELLKQHKTPEDIPPHEYEKAIVETNQVLFDYIKEMSKSYDKVIIMVGSNRTSAEKDQEDGVKNENGSAYRAIEHFANGLGKDKEIKLPVETNKKIIFDSVLGQEPGYNFGLSEKQTLDNSVRGRYLMSGDMKFRLAYFQIHDICANNPDSDVTYVHADDRDDIVTVSVNTYGTKEKNKEIGAMLPPNLKKASFLHYEEYNPIAELVRIQRDIAVRMANKIPTDESYILSTKERIKSATSIIITDMELLVQLSKEQQLDDKTQAEVRKAENILEKLKSPQSPQLPPLITQLDEIKTVDDLNSVCMKINGVMNNNVRYENLKLPPDVSKKYEDQRKILYQQRVTEFGTFDRRERDGYTIPQTQYDSLVTKCCQDDYPKNSNSVDTLRQITGDSRCYEFEQLVGKLKEALVLEKKGSKWSDMIINKYQEIDYKDRDEKKIAIMQLSNMIYTLRHHIAAGNMNYQEAIIELKPSIEKVIDKAQNKSFFGWLGITKSDVAKELTSFKKDLLEFKGKMKEIPSKSEEETYEWKDNPLHKE